MKPKNIKELRAKEVRAIYKRLRIIGKKQQELGYYKLEKPIRHGWYKELVITENVERYRNREAILEVYNKLEKQFWGVNKEEATKIWLAQISKDLIYRGLPTLSHKSFNKLTDRAKRLCTVYIYRDNLNRRKKRFYVRIPRGAYKIRFKRAYVTHRKRIDPLLEQEMDLLYQQLNKKGYYEEHQKIYNYRAWGLSTIHKSRKQVKSDLKNLKRISIEEIIKDNILWEKN